MAASEQCWFGIGEAVLRFRQIGLAAHIVWQRPIVQRFAEIAISEEIDLRWFLGRFAGKNFPPGQARRDQSSCRLGWSKNCFPGNFLAKQSGIMFRKMFLSPIRSAQANS